MFKRILIANRGEIACRIIKTARRMGIATVAVYSDADRHAMHVEMADAAVHIGASEALKSYLRGDQIIRAAQETGAQAIHPGYGFLSENPDFVEAVEQERLTFVGPSAKSIRAMGLKDAAKSLMHRSGVPVVPGYHGEAQDTVVLATKASEIGYPVLIKARAGGGGKGMRKVDSPDQFREALAAAKREAKSAFGDDRVLVEKFIEKPRHIEVQVFGDLHGNVVHLFERDCSLQRRHQKVIEEAPAPGMHDEMRRAMTEAAVRAAQAISYSGAGTVEFIVDASQGLKPDRFWFMEMNTRLQVEHPVTELITGHDLVEWQLRVAAGEKLPRAQSEIALQGHAFEARIYAEDVEKGFLPATGTLHHLAFPDKARVDSGVRQGDAVLPYYDPMIAKLCVHAPNRAEALARLDEGLSETKIAGLVTNLPFLLTLARHAGFADADVDTGLIERDQASLCTQPPAEQELKAAAALVALGLLDRGPRSQPAAQIGAWALWEPMPSHVELSLQGEGFHAAITPSDARHWRVEIEDETVEIALLRDPSGRVEIAGRDGRRTAHIVQWPGHVTLITDEAAYDFAILDPRTTQSSEEESGDSIIAPMSGLVKVMHVAAGDKVVRGRPLIVLEAMKMEHPLNAPRDGRVAQIRAGEGQQVSEGQILLTLAEEQA